MTPDPACNAVADLTNPQSWNMYSHVTNSPATLTDPSGLDGEDHGGDDGGGIGGCFLGCGGSSGPIWIEAGPLPGVPNLPRSPSGGIDWQTLVFGPPDPSSVILSNYNGGSACGPVASVCDATYDCPDDGGPCAIQRGL